MHSLWRTTVALALAPGLVVSSVVAPAHVHEADAHHSHAVVHRHFEPHDHDGAEIAGGEGHVVWLDDVGVQQATYQLAVAQAVVPAPFDALPEPNSWIAISSIDTAPPHGPPRSSTSLRAPPLLSL